MILQLKQEVDYFDAIILLEACLSVVYQVFAVFCSFDHSFMVLIGKFLALIVVKHVEDLLDFLWIIRGHGELFCFQVEFIEFFLLMIDLLTQLLSYHFLIQ